MTHVVFTIPENYSGGMVRVVTVKIENCYLAMVLATDTRGATTTTSHPSHILLIFSSEPPRNPRPSIIMCLKISNSSR